MERETHEHVKYDTASHTKDMKLASFMAQPGFTQRQAHKLLLRFFFFSSTYLQDKSEYITSFNFQPKLDLISTLSTWLSSSKLHFKVKKVLPVQLL
jgi:hypothetical protein